MVTEPTPTSHTERIGFVITSAGTHYTGITAGLILGVPIVAFLSGNATLLFYVHIGLGAFGSGSIIFFFQIRDGACAQAGRPGDRNFDHPAPHAEDNGGRRIADSRNDRSGIGLAYRLGYWATPSVYLWGALGVATVMLLIAFGPLHAL